MAKVSEKLRRMMIDTHTPVQKHTNRHKDIIGPYLAEKSLGG